MTIREWTAGLGLIAAFAASGPAFAANAAAGKATFKAQCALCHTAEPGDNGGAQGPALTGVFGRKAASNAAFSYTKALRDSGLTWDAKSLERFLESPTTVVPGTSMVVPVAKKTDRENIVAYFQSVKDLRESAPVAWSAPAAARAGSEDWKLDKPGRVHKVDVTKLPAPFETPSARNSPKFVDRPAGAQASLPPGFSLAVFATKLAGPRRMVVAANGDVILTETRGGKVSVMHPSADNSKAETVTTFADDLKQPFGVAFYPNAKTPQWLYVAETNRVVRYPYKTGDQKASGKFEIVVAELPTGGGHTTRDIVFSPDGKLMYVSVGSASNVAENMEKKKPGEIQAWDAENGLGATWGPETHRAAVLVFEVGSNKPGRNWSNFRTVTRRTSPSGRR